MDCVQWDEAEAEMATKDDLAGRISDAFVRIKALEDERRSVSPSTPPAPPAPTSRWARHHSWVTPLVVSCFVAMGAAIYQVKSPLKSHQEEEAFWLKADSHIDTKLVPLQNDLHRQS